MRIVKSTTKSKRVKIKDILNSRTFLFKLHENDDSVYINAFHRANDEVDKSKALVFNLKYHIQEKVDIDKEVILIGKLEKLTYEPIRE